MKLEKMNLVELNATEAIIIDGGGVFSACRKLWEKRGQVLNAIDKGLTYIGYYDAISDFKDGWNSVPTRC